MKARGAENVPAVSSGESQITQPGTYFEGKRAGMVTFSCFPYDPRPRRAVEALLDEGMAVDLICLAEPNAPARETKGRLRVTRAPLEHTRGGKLQYAYNYLAFILISAYHLTAGLFRGRYDLVHIHNMPDVLVFSALIPKLFGAKVILDQHDPMPELMTTIFSLSETSFAVRLIKALEWLSLGFADAVITVNVACKRIFSDRGCRPEKISIVMNAPDDKIFPLIPAGDPAATPLPSEKFVIMYHGSLVERNGLDLAVAALAKLGDDLLSKVEMRVYGRETAFLRQVQEQARTLGLADVVSFRGQRRVDDLPAEIRECDLGVIPNQRNAFTDINTPTRIFEYLAMGKPVVAPSTMGITDYFDGDSLMFFESGNVDDLADQLKAAIRNPKKASEIAKLGQALFANHTWPQERQRLLDTVESLIGRSTVSRRAKITDENPAAKAS